MRRKDRQVGDIREIEGIIAACKTCHVAMVDDGEPYVLPLSFAYELDASGALTLYFHSAKQGRKVDALRKNARVCFEMCIEGEPIFAEINPCHSGYYFSSVVGRGDARLIENTDEKRRALSLLMKHQANLDIDFTFEQAQAVNVYKIVCSEFSGKRKPRPEA